MKTFCTLLIVWILALFNEAAAQEGKHGKDSTTVTIYLDNFLNGNAQVDSVLVILDRYSLNGAGIVRKTYYPQNNTISIRDVPRGKYYLDVFCLGIYQQSFSTITYIYDERKNRNLFRFRLKQSEVYDSSTVYIPKEKIDFSKLSIYRPWVNR